MGVGEFLEERVTVERLMVLVCSTASVILFFIIHFSISEDAGSQRQIPQGLLNSGDRKILDLDTSTVTKQLVMGHLKNESISWVYDELLDFPAAIYTVDDIEKSEYKVPRNKGKEAMPYLTYIIDHYDDLKDVTIFLHAHRKARHNDAPGLDTVKALRYLRMETVMQRGYVNLRCKWNPGCPDEIHPLRAQSNPKSYGRQTEKAYADAWRAFFGEDVPVPDVVGVACCAQFAVTRKSIRRRSREDYIRYRQWLLDTPLEDEVSGRVLEYTWHVFMGEIDEYSEGVYCPDPQLCECEVYGVINGRCELPGIPQKFPAPPSGW